MQKLRLRNAICTHGLLSPVSPSSLQTLPLEKLREKVVLEKRKSLLSSLQGAAFMRNLDMSNRISIHYVRDFGDDVKKRNYELNFATIYSQFCNKVCFKIANLFQQNRYMREQLEHNKFDAYLCQVLVRETRWAQRSVPSWTDCGEICKTHSSSLAHFSSHFCADLVGSRIPPRLPWQVSLRCQAAASTTSPSAVTATSKLQVPFEAQHHGFCGTCVVP